MAKKKQNTPKAISINGDYSVMLRCNLPAFEKAAKTLTANSTSSSAIAKKTLVRSGILTKSGNLTSKYK